MRTAAHQLPRSLRSAFLQRLAAQLDGREFGDGQLQHTIMRERAKPFGQEEPLRGFNVGL